MTNSRFWVQFGFLESERSYSRLVVQYPIYWIFLIKALESITVTNICQFVERVWDALNMIRNIRTAWCRGTISYSSQEGWDAN